MDSQRKKIGLALSGGGYRAAAYHIGTFRALRKLNILDKIDIISSVSGGSITSAYYALNKDDYEHFESTLINKLQKGVMAPVWVLIFISVFLTVAFSFLLGYFCFWWLNLQWMAVTAGLISFISIVAYVFWRWYNFMPISKLISCGYDCLFFQNKTLDDLPDSPVLTINATNIATNLPFNFSKGYMGEFAYTLEDKSIFDATKFPISKAVMASSCVPYGFTPIRINEEYMLHSYTECKNNPEPPLLVDGGIYDNQGAHKLSMKKSRFHADIIIVSDAGNSNIKAENTNNFISTLIKTSDMMMDRIKKLQVSQNIYEGYEGHSHYVYVPLKWNCSEWLLNGFIRNIKDGNVHPDLLEKHGVDESDINGLKSFDTTKEQVVLNKLKKSIDWDVLIKNAPTGTSEDLVRNIGTNLVALKKEEINSLIAHSEWLTTVQVKLYYPQ